MDPAAAALSAETAQTINLLVAAAMLAIYFLPAIIASVREHARVTQITIMNVLFGWTIIGWAAALRMALEKAKPAPPDKPAAG